MTTPAVPDLTAWLRQLLDAWERDADEREREGLRRSAEDVRRKVEAQRGILDWLDEVDRFMERDDMSWHYLAGEVDTDQARRLLALMHADEPGYREEWRPS